MALNLPSLARLVMVEAELLVNLIIQVFRTVEQHSSSITVSFNAKTVVLALVPVRMHVASAPSIWTKKLVYLRLTQTVVLDVGPVLQLVLRALLILLKKRPRSCIGINILSACLLVGKKCPAQINIPKYLAHAKNGEYAAALATVKDNNPLAVATGRVCPELCATECRRQVLDDPLAINAVKRFLSDWEKDGGERLQVSVAPDTGYKIAIVGGGPSGLSAAYYLARLGHQVEIFEMMPKLGGMPLYGIPDYRLSEEQYSWDVNGVLELGVKAHTGMKLGEDFTLETLKKLGFDATYLALGCWTGRMLPFEGKELKGICSGIDYLRRFHTDEDLIKGKRFVIIGAGNVAMDCARSALRAGAESVLLIFRFSRELMEANPHEITDAEEEGVEMRCLVSPMRFVGEDGILTGVETQQVTLKDNPGGMPDCIAVEDTIEILECDVVIQAVGQGADIQKISETDGLEKTRFSTIDASEKTLETNIPGVFAGGDCFTGPRLLVEAVAGGTICRQIYSLLCNHW